MCSFLECNIPLGSTYFLFNFVIRVTCHFGYSLHLISPHILCVLGKLENNVSSLTHLSGTVSTEELNYLYLFPCIEIKDRINNEVLF